MSIEKKYLWHKIAGTLNELNFKQNNLVQIEVAGKSICIAKGREVYACTSKCPHAGGIISDGYIDQSDNITCPLHGYKFSLQNGENISDEGYYLKTYPIQINEEGIFVGIEQNGLFSS